MSKKLVNLLLVIMMLAVLVPTTLAAPPAQEEGQDYVVVADDWLSKLADKYLGNPLAYPAIVEYTNQKNAEDASYANITDPDLIEVGWKIYIPSAAEATAYLEAPTVEAAATQPPTAPTDTPIPKPTVGGKIAFPVFDPKRGTYDIFIANTDGSDREKIKEEASQPCLSPDGSEITYRSWHRDKRGLIVAHTFGEDIWTITTIHEASRPGVLTGGIVFHARQALDTSVHIYLSHGDKGAEVIRWGDQRRPVLGESPAWVSGERLVYKGGEGGNYGLYLTDSAYDGTGIAQLTYDLSDANPEASPDGKKVAFMSRRDGNWEIYVVDLDGTVKRLTTNGANDGLPIWSPDGQTIAFASDRDGEWAIWAMNPDGSNQRVLFPLGGSLHGYVQDVPEYKGGGWEEERLSWSP